MECRPTLQNLALAANVKMELIAELLQLNQHDVEILSQGEVVEQRFKFYPAFRDSKPFHADVPVFYASALPIKFINGMWSSMRTLKLLKQRHRASPYDLLIIYNLKRPQVVCADYALHRLKLPVVLEYEDDAFVDIGGKAERGFRSGLFREAAQQIVNRAAGCIGVSPHLLSRTRASIPKMLLRGVVDQDILDAGEQSSAARKNWVVYSGTHYRSKGLEPLVKAWGMLNLPGWELHIAGRGELTAKLEKMAENNKTIVFHGLLNRQENARFLGSAKIGINPHDVSETPGNVFAFKIVEYLAAGAHCITTPMGELEADLEAGMTYMAENSPETIAATLKRVIGDGRYMSLATQAAQARYGPGAVAASLDRLLNQVLEMRTKKNDTKPL